MSEAANSKRPRRGGDGCHLGFDEKECPCGVPVPLEKKFTDTVTVSNTDVKRSRDQSTSLARPSVLFRIQYGTCRKPDTRLAN